MNTAIMNFNCIFHTWVRLWASVLGLGLKNFIPIVRRKIAFDRYTLISASSLVETSWFDYCVAIPWNHPIITLTLVTAVGFAVIGLLRPNYLGLIVTGSGLSTNNKTSLPRPRPSGQMTIAPSIPSEPSMPSIPALPGALPGPRKPYVLSSYLQSVIDEDMNKTSIPHVMSPQLKVYIEHRIVSDSSSINVDAAYALATLNPPIYRPITDPTTQMEKLWNTFCSIERKGIFYDKPAVVSGDFNFYLDNVFDAAPEIADDVGALYIIAGNRIIDHVATLEALL
jgi:hypothetical protein